MDIQRTKREDSKAIISLYKEYRPNWKQDIDLSDILENYPSFTVWKNQELIAFVYSKPFAPDVLEILNIYVNKEYRNNKLGTSLLTVLEASIDRKQFSAIIAVNSDGYEGKKNNLSAHSFYMKSGYSLAFQTKLSRIYCKELK